MCSKIRNTSVTCCRNMPQQWAPNTQLHTIAHNFLYFVLLFDCFILLPGSPFHPPSPIDPPHFHKPCDSCCYEVRFGPSSCSCTTSVGVVAMGCKAGPAKAPGAAQLPACYSADPQQSLRLQDATRIWAIWAPTLEGKHKPLNQAELL